MAVYTCRSSFGSFPIVIIVGFGSPSSLSLPQAISGPPSIHPVLILNVTGTATQCPTGDPAPIPGQIGLESDAQFGTADVFMAITAAGLPDLVEFGDPYVRYDVTARSEAAYGDVSIALPSGLEQPTDFGAPPVGSFFVAGNLANLATFGTPSIYIESGPAVSIDSKFGFVPLVVPQWDVQVFATFGHPTVSHAEAVSVFKALYPIPPGPRLPTYYLEVQNEARLPYWKAHLHRIYARSLPSQRPARDWIIK